MLLKKGSLSSESDYIEQFVTNGWGGIPELHQCARKHAVRFFIWDDDNRCLATIGASSASVIGHLKYSKEHYAVIADPKSDAFASRVSTWRYTRRGGAGNGSESRSPEDGKVGSSSVKLLSREERLKKEREAIRQLQDTRPPLPRKRNDDSQAQPSRSRASPPQRDAPPPPAMEPKKSKKEKKEAKEKSRRDMAKSVVKAKAMPVKRQRWRD